MSIDTKSKREVMPTTLVIIGVTGDLSRRKLLPAIAEIAAAKALPADFTIIGITRQNTSIGTLLSRVHLTKTQRSFLAHHLVMHKMRLEEADDYTTLKDRLDAIAPTDTHQRLFYLSVPPQVSQPIVRLLGSSGLAAQNNTKLLLEKPFGTDLTSAQELIEETQHSFHEEAIYRIDHYLAKEMAQDLVVFRSHNALFKRTWNNTFIEKIQIIASEQIDIEGRAQFYEQTGALRDVVQGHLMQLAALVLMELPATDNWHAIPKQRHIALQYLQVPQDLELSQRIIRGQYQGYRDEVQVPQSHTETFVAATFFSNDPKWQGVPIQLISGKALAKKSTEIRIHYKKDTDTEANILTLRIQPQEGIEIIMWAKKPGYSNEVEELPLHFMYKDHYQSLPEAYERVLVDAIRSDRNLFTSSAEVLAAWKLLEPIQHAWSMHNDDLRFYKKGADITDILEDFRYN